MQYRHKLTVLSLSLSALAFVGCASATSTEDDREAVADTSQDQAPTGQEGADTAGDDSAARPVLDGNVRPLASGASCTAYRDAQGFFTRYSTQGAYVVYVPSSYRAGTPTRVIVGLHGCGDTAQNFATWAINPWKTRGTQNHIGISLGGESGSNRCWMTDGRDDAKIAAAIDDLAYCYSIDRRKIVLAGYSSGGQLAYRVAMRDSGRFAGLLIENSALYAAGDVQSLLWASKWRLNIAHRAHTGDTVFPITRVRTDWDTLRAWQFPLQTSELAGGHSGAGEDWSDYLIPKSAYWTRPW